MPKILVFILLIVFAFFQSCGKEEDRKFWLLQDNFTQRQFPESRKEIPYGMTLSKNSSKIVSKRVYFKVSNLFLFEGLNGFISYDSLGYHFLSNFNDKEYVLFQTIRTSLNTSVVIPIDKKKAIKITYLTNCNMAKAYGKEGILEVFSIKELENGNELEHQTLRKAYLKDSELIGLSFCGELLSCYLFDYYNNKIDLTGIYQPCDVYRTPLDAR